MLKPLILALGLLATGAEAQEMRQFFAETPSPLDQITAQLSQGLPEDAALTAASGAAYLSYTGTRVPPGLAQFLAAAFPDLDQAAIAPGQTVTLSVVMTQVAGGTDLSLMVMGRFEPRAGVHVPGGQILMDGRGAEPCSGQVLIQHAEPPETLLQSYIAAFEAQGFLFEEPHEEAMSFFFGHAPDCAVALYVEGQSGGSTAVIRYLEE